MTSLRATSLALMLVLGSACVVHRPAVETTPVPTLLSSAAAAAVDAARRWVGFDEVLSVRFSTYGAEAAGSEIVDASTPVWAVRVSGSFPPASCGGFTVTPHPCPSPATTMLILVDASTYDVIMAEMPAP